MLRIMHTLACQWGEVIFKHWLWSNNRCWDKTGAFSETGRRRIFKLNTKEALLMLSQKQLCRKKQVQMKTERFFSGDLFQKTKKQTNLFLLFFCSFLFIVQTFIWQVVPLSTGKCRKWQESRERVKADKCKKSLGACSSRWGTVAPTCVFCLFIWEKELKIMVKSCR